VITAASKITSDPDARSVRVAVEVVDIFGNDTLTIVDVAVGGKTGTAK